jgi:hypothetical protein
MVPEVGGQGFADVGGQRQAGVLASLAPHLQLAGPPIDVIELQGEDLARPQPQAGQKEEDGAIAAVGAVVPLASTDDPFDLFGGEVLRQFGGPPLRHGRDGPGEVALRLPAQEEKSKEGAQGGHHHLGHGGAARASVSQEETRDVAGGQVPDADRPIPEALAEETPGELPVMADGHRGEATFFLEVVPILPTDDRQRRLVSHRLRGSNDAVPAQVAQEAMYGPWITMPEVSAGSSPLQKECDDGVAQIEEDHASLPELSIENVQEP